MDYLQNLCYHYKPKKGWVNDPNGLVYFKGYYHIFYQHAPNFETPWKEPMHWGHARTKNFIDWEELPVALFPDRDMTTMVAGQVRLPFLRFEQRKRKNSNRQCGIFDRRDSF